MPDDLSGLPDDITDLPDDITDLPDDICELADDAAELQDALLRTETVEEFLRELARLAARIVDDGGSCGMTLGARSRQAFTVACSDPLAARADAAQYRMEDGPCLTAIREGRAVRIDAMAADDRWPAFSRRAVSMGVRSSLSLPLLRDGRPVGALNVYARKDAAFGPRQVRRARKLARSGSGALALALRMSAITARGEQLRSAMESRAVIDQAMGVIMALRRCTQDEALAILRAQSQNQNVKLRDVAAAIIARVSGEPPRQPSPFEDG
jgi:transcriptional regulator with GAF, ATPase, and Fis domain